MAKGADRYVWRAPADKLVRRYYPACGAPLVAEMLGIEPWQVRYYASKIGVKTNHRGGKPFESVDSRRGPGKKFTKQTNQSPQGQEQRREERQEIHRD